MPVRIGLPGARGEAKTCSEPTASFGSARVAFVLAAAGVLLVLAAAASAASINGVASTNASKANAIRWTRAPFATGAATLLTGAAALPPNDFVIVLDRRIGPFDYRDRGYSSAYARAVRAFGAPSSRTLRTNICFVKWKRIGLTVAFLSSACQGRAAIVCSASARQRRWRTGRGLGVGDSESRIRRFYPGARLHSRTGGSREWWLVTRSLGELGSYGALSATTRDGRVVEIGIDRACD